jgi:hypothetical protein
VQHDTGSLVFVEDFVAVIDDEWRPSVADGSPVDWS